MSPYVKSNRHFSILAKSPNRQSKVRLINRQQKKNIREHFTGLQKKTIRGHIKRQKKNIRGLSTDSRRKPSVTIRGHIKRKKNKSATHSRRRPARCGTNTVRRLFSMSSFASMPATNPASLRQSKRRPARPAELTEEQRQEIKEAFDLFDINKDGAIDYHELKWVFTKALSILFFPRAFFLFSIPAF